MTDDIRRRGVFVLIGCGEAKQDTEEPVPAHSLYTSAYFGLKRRFAEAATQWAGQNQSSAWAILSAEHGVSPHGLEIKTYDTTIEDLDEPAPEHIQGAAMPNGEEVITELDWWARGCAPALETWLRYPFRSDGETPCGQFLVLAGRSYIEPLRERGVFGGSHDGLPVEPRFPFEEQELGGIGEQMAWLKTEAARLETEHAPAQRSELTSFGGGYKRNRALWQLGQPSIEIEATEQATLEGFEDVPDRFQATEQRTLATDRGNR